MCLDLNKPSDKVNDLPYLGPSKEPGLSMLSIGRSIQGPSFSDIPAV